MPKQKVQESVEKVCRKFDFLIENRGFFNVLQTFSNFRLLQSFNNNSSFGFASRKFIFHLKYIFKFFFDSNSLDLGCGQYTFNHVYVRTYGPSFQQVLTTIYHYQKPDQIFGQETWSVRPGTQFKVYWSLPGKVGLPF